MVESESRLDVIKLAGQLSVFTDYSEQRIKDIFRDGVILFNSELYSCRKGTQLESSFQVIFDDSDLECLNALLSSWCVNSKVTELTINPAYESHMMSAIVFTSLDDKSSPVLLVENIYPVKKLRPNIIEFHCEVSKIR